MLFNGLKTQKNLLSVEENGVSAFKLKNLTPVTSVERLILDQLQTLTQNLETQFYDYRNERWGLILASTKGVLEDFIWQDSVDASYDPYQAILKGVKQNLNFSFSKEITVSNACASSHGALELGQKWLQRKTVDHVLIVAADLIGPFVHKGFSALRALSQNNECKPFDIKRDGLLLGDGIGVVVLSTQPIKQNFYLEQVYNQCEGFSVTRPDTSGETLSHCIKQSISTIQPDLMIAHATATYYNDITESNSIAHCFKGTNPPKITATKWSVGHSLGASGLIDLNAACEMITQQEATGIHNLNESDFKIGEWILSENKKMEINSVLISSLGFGGICSSFIVRKGDS